MQYSTHTVIQNISYCNTLCTPPISLILSPTELRKIGKGVVLGAISLVGHSADGFIGTGTTLSRSLGRNVAFLSMDNAFIQRRRYVLCVVVCCCVCCVLCMCHVCFGGREGKREDVCMC